MNIASTRFRMRHSGLVNHGYVGGSDVDALRQRRLVSTIFVGERAPIEVTRS